MSPRELEKSHAPGTVDKSLVQAEREIEIGRQQELRSIEQENKADRERMINEKTSQDKLADRRDKSERSKFSDAAASGDTAVEGGEIVPPSVEAVVPEKPEVKAPVVEQPVVPVPETPSAADVRAAKEKANREAARRKKAEQEKSGLTKQEQQYRNALELEQRKLAREKDLLEKAKRDQGQPTENASGISAPVDKDAALRLSAERERRLLDQQRVAIRRDFEAGVERLYNEAVDLFKKHLYEESREDFLQVSDMIKGYKKTDYYLGQIDKVLKTAAKRAPLTVPVLAPPAETAPRIDPVLPASGDGRTKAVSQALDSFDAGPRR